MNQWLHDIELIGKKVKLIPLRKSHSEFLVEAASDGELWNLKVSDIIIGATRFCNATPEHRHLEIGNREKPRIQFYW